MLLFRLILILLLSICNTYLFGQKHSSRTRHNADISYHIGPAFFQGDVPSGIILSTKKVSEIKSYNNNLNFGIGYSNRFHNKFGFKTNLNVLQLCGNDKWGNSARRAIKFRTYSADLSILIEYSFINWANVNKENYTPHFFISTGIALFYFVPLSEYQNKWYSLRELGTEGQGLKPGTKFYSPVSFAIPINVGYRKRINRRDTWGAEFCYRNTSTDYIDDVSTNYYDNGIIAEKRGPAAAYLADPDTRKHKNGSGRGNPGKHDSYSFINISYSRTIGLPKHKVHSNKLKWLSPKSNKI